MAGGLMLMGVLGAVLSVEHAMIVHGISQLTANGSRSLNLIKHVCWKPVLFYTIGACISFSFFLYVQFIPSKPLLFLFLGLMPFISLIRKFPRLDFAENNLHAVICGVVVTLAHLSAGVSGPLLDLFFVKSKASRFQVVATKATTQSTGHLMKLVYFGNLATDFSISVWMVGAIVVAAITGTLLGNGLLKRLSDENFRLYTQRIVLCLGMIYLAKAAHAFVVTGG